jgi:hypothetical protein
MSFVSSVRNLEKNLRVVLIATALLIVPQIGQFIAIASINSTGHMSDLAIFFEFAAVLVVPTSVILTGVILALLRQNWREHERIFILGFINLLIALNLTWFFVDQCSWSQVFGLALRGCHR